MRLVRNLFVPEGIFSRQYDEQGKFLFDTVEHAYLVDGFWKPKIPNGIWVCVRGLHRLHPEGPDFETFEITGVPNHKGLLWHPGNTENDSEGCVITGERQDTNVFFLVQSRDTFLNKFMAPLAGVQTFNLVVEG